jgi:hypothetical protein
MKTIPLSQGRVAIVDDRDFETLNRYKWYAQKIGNTLYAARHATGRHRTIYMHRQIPGITDPGIFVDHRNGNGLDNRRQNLRLATKTENARNRPAPKNNTSGFKGVHWHKQGNAYRARIKVNGKNIHLGLFPTPTEAARAYDQAARKYFGEFARTNFGD